MSLTPLKFRRKKEHSPWFDGVLYNGTNGQDIIDWAPQVFYFNTAGQLAIRYAVHSSIVYPFYWVIKDELGNVFVASPEECINTYEESQVVNRSKITAPNQGTKMSDETDYSVDYNDNAQMFNELTPAEVERLAMLAEECSEVIKCVGKILRHGYASFNPDDPKHTGNRSELTKEIHDILKIVGLMELSDDLYLQSEYPTGHIKHSHHQTIHEVHYSPIHFYKPNHYDL